MTHSDCCLAVVRPKRKATLSEVSNLIAPRQLAKVALLEREMRLADRVKRRPTPSSGASGDLGTGRPG